MPFRNSRAFSMTKTISACPTCGGPHLPEVAQKLRDAAAEIKRLQDENAKLRRVAEPAVMQEYHNIDDVVEIRRLQRENAELRAELGALAPGAGLSVEPKTEPDEFMCFLDEWAKAYPLDVFPLPDFVLVASALKMAGLSLDCVSAANMRHVITRVRERYIECNGVNRD